MLTAILGTPPAALRDIERAEGHRDAGISRQGGCKQRPRAFPQARPLGPSTSATGRSVRLAGPCAPISASLLPVEAQNGYSPSPFNVSIALPRFRHTKVGLGVPRTRGGPLASAPVSGGGSGGRGRWTAAGPNTFGRPERWRPTLWGVADPVERTRRKGRFSPRGTPHPQVCLQSSARTSRTGRHPDEPTPDPKRHGKLARIGNLGIDGPAAAMVLRQLVRPCVARHYEPQLVGAPGSHKARRSHPACRPQQPERLGPRPPALPRSLVDHPSSVFLATFLALP